MVIILIVPLNYPYAIVHFDEEKKPAFDFGKEETPLSFDLRGEILLPYALQIVPFLVNM